MLDAGHSMELLEQTTFVHWVAVKQSGVSSSYFVNEPSSFPDLRDLDTMFFSSVNIIKRCPSLFSL